MVKIERGGREERAVNGEIIIKTKPASFASENQNNIFALFHRSIILTIHFYL
jgi:hypothetical protein